ncbi:MAG: alanine racemase [Magnetospirillum sp.]|nr:alanine racemase [Magnetospirillum sp.]
MRDRDTALLTIDLDAIVANWRLIAARAAPAEAAAVVKADAYGLGAVRVAAALAAAGCRTFFVATIDEGLELRAVLPHPDIFVLSGVLPGPAGDITAAGLIPVLNSLEQAALWQGRAALHVDTGMARLGLEAAEIERLIADPGVLAGIDVDLVCSHLACADEDSAMNADQCQRFRLLADRLGLGRRRSLAASSGVFLGPAFHFDLVRPGAALYGVNPTPGRPNPMAQVVRLQGKILQVRDVDSPMTVGYGASHRCAGRGRVATVAVGYADGWLRALSNRGHGIIEGGRVPLVGRVSMDLITFDVSAVPASAAHAGATIELIGPGHDVDAVAAEAGTIGYEVLTALGRRYARSYVGGGV